MDSRFAVPGVDAFTPLCEAAPALLLGKAEPLFELEAAASSGADMDAVHDMRVASRRLRETMRLLDPLYPMSEYGTWYKRVRRITRALGPVRDADVFIDEFAKLGKSLGRGGQRAVAFLIGHRMGTREQELVTLNHELSRLDLAENRRSLRKLAASVSGSPDAKRTLASFAHAAVAERMGVVFGALPDALHEENMHEQHALRIDFKRLRYAVEVFAPVYADDFDDLHDTLTEFQDTLGDMHDLHLFIDLLREPERVTAARRAGVSASDMGEVVALLEGRAKEKYDTFVALTAEHPASELLPALLLPLSRRPEAADAAATDDVAADTAAIAPSAAPSPAVVIAPPAPIAYGAMPPIDPAAQPWRSDAAGLEFDPPVVVGAQPWARASLESPAPDPTGAPESAAPALRLAPEPEAEPGALTAAPQATEERP